MSKIEDVLIVIACIIAAYVDLLLTVCIYILQKTKDSIPSILDILFYNRKKDKENNEEVLPNTNNE